MHNWDKGQSEFLELARTTEDNLQINAVAGSGKTTVIVEACKRMRTAGCSGLVVAFNKAIASELSERLEGTGYATGTFHSVCFQFLKTALRMRMKVNGYKVMDAVRKKYPSLKDDWRKIADLVSKAKMQGCGIIAPNNREMLEELCYSYDIEFDNNRGECLDAAKWVLKRSLDDFSELDFDDMLYMALHLVVDRGMEMDKWPVVLVDEFQDMNGLQLELLKGMGHRIIGVGDEAQGIYGFRGAGTDTMQKTVSMFNMTVINMSTTYRCPVAVVELAQKFVPELTARPDAPRGTVEWITPDDVWFKGLLEEGTLVVCRNNAPLFGYALALLKQQRDFKMSGKFPAMLKGFCKKLGGETIQVFRVRLKNWFEEMRDELMQKQNFGALQRIEDRYDCLEILAKDSFDLPDLIGKLDAMMYSDNGVYLSTIHGAKGLEAERVVFLYPSLLPSKYATSETALKQENNLEYVALTRAKEELFLVEE